MAATTASVVVLTPITHVSSGAAMAAGALSGTADVSAGTIGSANTGRYPSADIALTFSHTTSLSSASNALYLYRRDLNVDGTADEPVPGSAYATNSTISPSYYKSKFVGAFVANAVSLTGSTYSQTLQMSDVPLPTGDVEFYLENGTNAALLAGWTLKVTPKTLAAA
jgi:hypothetical protein